MIKNDLTSSGPGFIIEGINQNVFSFVRRLHIGEVINHLFSFAGSAFIGLLSRILPKNVEMSGEVTTGVTIQLPWLEQSRAVDAIATPAGGVVIDQPVENIDENGDV